ncbi:hypothetical protein [Thalassiella azotivora]
MPQGGNRSSAHVSSRSVGPGGARGSSGPNGHDAGPGARLPRRHVEPAMRPAGERRLAESCPGCRGTTLVAMDFRLKDGGTARMRRCGRCEWRSWWLGDRQVPLVELLERVSTAGLPNAPRQKRAS